jgi:hypothetical protein
LELVRDLDSVLATLKDNVRRTQVRPIQYIAAGDLAADGMGALGPYSWKLLVCLRRQPLHGIALEIPVNRLCLQQQDVLRAFERSLMFERKEGKVYAADELAEASAALMASRHAEMREAGKEIGKLLSASNRVVKV